MRENKSENEEVNESPLKDRSLRKMAFILGTIIVIMAYLTLYVDDPWKWFKPKKEVVSSIDDRNVKLDRISSMSDEELKASLTKFIQAFYYDQRQGYFDPPSYFATITKTFYNYHHLNYKNLRDIYWRRRGDMQGLKMSWMPSTIEFVRNNSTVIVTYWTKESYFRVSTRHQYSAQIKHEMVIDKNGLIESLRSVEVKNEVSNYVPPDTVEVSPVDSVANIIIADVEKTAPAKVYDISEVEVVPIFPGGHGELEKYFQKNMKYPALAKRNGVQGKVYIGFVIEADGSVANVSLKQGIGDGCDEEAVRLILSSPKWRPGKVAGNAVRTYCVLPVTFSL